MALTFESLFGLGFSQVLIGFARASGLMFSAPVFQSRNIIPQVKIIIAFALAVFAAPFVKNSIDLNHVSLLMAVFTLLQEVLVGLIMGFIANITIYAAQLAGFFIDVAVGFSVVNIIDPTTGTEMPLMGQLNSMMAMAIFLAINGHHTLILSFIQSYNVIQPGMLVLTNPAVGVMVKAFSMMFFLGFQIGIPIIGAIFLADVTLGIIAKLIPQINVFVIGFPVKIILGLMLLVFLIPFYLALIENVFSPSGDAFRYVWLMLRNLHS